VGWKVYLSGLVTDSTTVDAEGHYEFPDLPHGSYQVSLEQKPGWLQTYPLFPTYYITINPTDTLVQILNFASHLINGQAFLVSQGWNMASLPVKPLSLAKADMFPSAISDAYWYSGDGYLTAETLEVGKGYWLKFQNDQYVFMAGDSITCDTVAVTEGWNLVGALSAPVAVGDIIFSPPEIKSSEFFHYDGSYQIADSLRPGRGYWIKTSGAGEIILGK
jgi:hypothetical protein